MQKEQPLALGDSFLRRPAWWGWAGHLWNGGLLYRKRRRALGILKPRSCAQATFATRDPTSPHQPQSRYLELSPIGNRRLRGVQVTRARPRLTHRPARAPRAGCVRAPGRPAPPRPLCGPGAGRRARPRTHRAGRSEGRPRSAWKVLAPRRPRGWRPAWSLELWEGLCNERWCRETVPGRTEGGWGRGYFGQSGGRPAEASGRPASLGSVGAAFLVTRSDRGQRSASGLESTTFGPWPHLGNPAGSGRRRWPRW